MNAGANQTLSVMFTPADTTDYTSARASVHINVGVPPWTPTITWANPTAIVYGTALGAAQLDATARVPGTFTYSPAAGTLLGAGNGQTLSVTFSPTDTTDYTRAIASAKLNVAQATPTITWPNPADILLGTPLTRGSSMRRHPSRAPSPTIPRQEPS